ncbi:hypothetical protein POM88_030876 [Heracleum sosnowskyi]|uniref:Uncharacterized protein n=1 Tax=Heracleum sosnowskyi TaxID=360622 RepID=A0AAD8HYE2_9APIA|nr:hypothetical protein POM88_030876 [Heracleum sosnowskyi]
MIVRPFGAWMRAEPRRKNHTLGSKWLRPGGGFPAASSAKKERSVMGKVVTENNGSVDNKGVNEGMMVDILNGDKGINHGVIQGGSSNFNRAPNLQNIINHNNNNLKDKTAEVDVTEIPIVDPKIRRINESSNKNAEETSGQDDDISMEIQDGSKNLILAGAVQQPRLAL